MRALRSTRLNCTGRASTTSSSRRAAVPSGRAEMKLLRVIWLLFQRLTLLLVRQPVWVFVGILQPVMYLLLFAPLLAPALEGPLGLEARAEVYRVFVPGLLVLIAIFGGL